MEKNKLKLSLIIPCYNEYKNLRLLVEKISKLDYKHLEIIIVNNGSTDNTKFLANELIKNESKFKLLNIQKNIGYGHGIMTGVKEASGDIIAWTHADLQTDPNDVIDVFNAYIHLPKFENSIIKGYRKGRNFFDFSFTYFMGLISSFLLKVKLSDINAQPKMFHRNFLKYLDKYPNDFSMDLFLLYQARSNDIAIHQYPVDFKKRLHGKAKGGGSIIGKIRLIIRTFSYILKLKSKLKIK
mgnify:CR=1 FL=1|tara:strand:+ start:446 stop:1165 length:720 start_codon:yes stop_codon:yes gene_type:complete